MEKLYIRTVVILPLIFNILRSYFFILKQCETVRTVQEYGKKSVRKKYGCIALIFRWLRFLRTSALFFVIFIEYTYRNILILFVHFSVCVFTVCFIIYIFVY